MVKARDRKMKIPPEKCPHFFKIYLPHRSSEKLHIPQDFIKHFNGVVPNKTILKCRNGRFWLVELGRDENNFFFQNGGSTRSERNAAVKVAEDRVLNSVNPKNPHFMTTIKPYRPHELHIPKKMLRENCLHIEPEMILRDPSGKSWPVKFTYEKDVRFALTTGWISVRRGNKLRKNG